MHVPGGMGSFGPSVDEVLKEANEAMTASVNAMFAARKRIAELEKENERLQSDLDYALRKHNDFVNALGK